MAWTVLNLGGCIHNEGYLNGVALQPEPVLGPEIAQFRNLQESGTCNRYVSGTKKTYSKILEDGGPCCWCKHMEIM